MVYSDLFGTGPELIPQILTLITILLSIGVWIWIYRRAKILEYLKILWPAAILWIIFGTLDVVITARGTYGAPWNEGNPATRYFIEQFGVFGTSIASFLWIGLWVGIVGVILYLFKTRSKNKENCIIAVFFGLFVFYTLAIFQLWGFSTWMDWMEPVEKGLSNMFYGEVFEGGTFWNGVFPTDIKQIIPGVVLSIIHLLFWNFISHKQFITN